MVTTLVLNRGICSAAKDDINDLCGTDRPVGVKWCNPLLPQDARVSQLRQLVAAAEAVMGARSKMVLGIRNMDMATIQPHTYIHIYIYSFNIFKTIVQFFCRELSLLRTLPVNIHFRYRVSDLQSPRIISVITRARPATH